MKTEIESCNLKPLTDNEVKLISGGGLWWYWLGETLHKIINVLNEIERANIEAPVSVSEWN